MVTLAEIGRGYILSLQLFRNRNEVGVRGLTPGAVRWRLWRFDWTGSFLTPFENESPRWYCRNQTESDDANHHDRNLPKRYVYPELKRSR